MSWAGPSSCCKLGLWAPAPASAPGWVVHRHWCWFFVFTIAWVSESNETRNMELREFSVKRQWHLQLALYALLVTLRAFPSFFLSCSVTTLKPLIHSANCRLVVTFNSSLFLCLVVFVSCNLDGNGSDFS